MRPSPRRSQSVPPHASTRTTRCERDRPNRVLGAFGGDTRGGGWGLGLPWDDIPTWPAFGSSELPVFSRAWCQVRRARPEETPSRVSVWHTAIERLMAHTVGADGVTDPAPPSRYYMERRRPLRQGARQLHRDPGWRARPTPTGKTPLPYTSVDRWAILGNRGWHFSTRSP